MSFLIEGRDIILIKYCILFLTTCYSQLVFIPVYYSCKKFSFSFSYNTCFIELPQWDSNNWMSVQPAHHLVLINGYTHNGPWYEGDSYLSYKDPYALAGCWKDYFNNELLYVTNELWKDYHFTGNIGRISVFTTKPYSEAFTTQRLDYDDPS